MEVDLPAVIRQFLTKTVSKDENIFELLLEEIEYLFHGKRAGDLKELKERESKAKKGTYWELFCYHYLKSVKEYDQVWMWKDLPEEVRKELKLKKKQDLGIDIIAQDGDEYIAIQCKYRKRNNVTWKQLSTFISYCERTGPYKKHLVLTNADKVMWEGNRGKKDRSICRATFEGLKRKDWEKIAGLTPRVDLWANSSDIPRGLKPVKLTKKEKVEKPQSLEELRDRRVAYFEKLALEKNDKSE